MDCNTFNSKNAIKTNIVEEIKQTTVFPVEFALIITYVHGNILFSLMASVINIENAIIIELFIYQKLYLQIGCCGADGPRDYISLQQPLPSQCRNSVTGNPYFHGCVHEMTWFFEEKCAWIAALAMTLCFIHVSILFNLLTIGK